MHPTQATLLAPCVPPRRLETVDAVVECEALAQAHAFAEAALEGERTTRLAAEQELALLAAAAEVRSWWFGGRCISPQTSLQLSPLTQCAEV